MSSFRQREGNNMYKLASCSSYKYSSVAENNVWIEGLFTTMVIKSHVKLHMKSWLMLLKSPGNLNLTLHLHYTFHSTIENFSACCNTSREVITSHVKLHMKSNAAKISRESTSYINTYITLFTTWSRIFLPAAILHVALSWPPCKPTIFARLARWQ